MSQQVVAWGESTPLEHIVQNKQDSHYGHHRIDEIRSRVTSCDKVTESVAPSEYQIQNHAYPKSECKVPSGIGTVRDYAVEKLRDTVYETYQSKDYAEARICDPVFVAQSRHGKREILPHEIVHGIAYHRTDDDPPLPVAERMVCFHFTLNAHM